MDTILAIDLGKFNSVFCWYQTTTNATTFWTVPTHQGEVLTLPEPDLLLNA